MANGDDRNGGAVRPTVITAWQLIGVAITVMATLGVSMWTIITDQNRANESILNELHSNYVPKSQHTDLADRLTREVSRVDELAREMLPRHEFERWLIEREKTIRDLSTRLSETISRREWQTLVDERARQIDAIRQRLDAHVNDDIKKRKDN